MAGAHKQHSPLMSIANKIFFAMNGSNNIERQQDGVEEWASDSCVYSLYGPRAVVLMCVCLCVCLSVCHIHLLYLHNCSQRKQ